MILFLRFKRKYNTKKSFFPLKTEKKAKNDVFFKKKAFFDLTF